MEQSVTSHYAQPSYAPLDELTSRQRRELEFYEEFASRIEPGEVSFAPVLGRERRPWNPNWFVYERAAELYSLGSRTLLDIGCGTGSSTVRLARLGYQVTGIDLSPACVRRATEVANRYGLADRTKIQTGIVEKLDFADATFDVVTGFDVLHHVEIEAGIGECLRVLKPGGTAIFKEWMHVPFIDGLRRLPPLRWIFPSGRSVEREVTHDERKLTARDLAKIRQATGEMQVHRFRILARLNRLVARRGGKASPLERLDARLSGIIPAIRHLGGTAVLVLTKEAGSRPAAD